MSCPADLAEWRADWFLGLRERERLLAMLKELRELLGEMPLLFTIRTREEGGEGIVSPGEYGQLNLEAARSGFVDLVDVELFRMSLGQAEEALRKQRKWEAGEPEKLLWPEKAFQAGEAKKGALQEAEVAGLAEFLQREKVTELIRNLQQAGVWVIGSSHDFCGTPGTELMVNSLRAMQLLGADMCKLAVMPQKEADVVKLLEVTWQMKEWYGDRPRITMSMGSLGILSRLSGELFGSAMTFGSAGRASAPGQVEAGALAGYLDLLHTEEKQGKEEEGRRPKESRGHIFLIGFMGTGKSTVAHMLREKLGWEQVEMDARLEEQEGQSIASMFEQYGEAYFRDKETRLLYSLEGQTPKVVSCGGGVVTREENRDFMKRQGRIVLLTATPKTILARVQGSQERPILNGNMNVPYIRRLMEEREPKYQAAADICIETDELMPEQVADKIMECCLGQPMR